MIKEFVEAWEARKGELREKWALAHPESYIDIVRGVVELLETEEYSWPPRPDPSRITVINHGHYQGTLLYIIAGKGYQPDDYWYVKVNYGSCSGCDTLQSIRGYSDEPPTEKQVNDYMTLALHVVQGLKSMNDAD